MPCDCQKEKRNIGSPRQVKLDQAYLVSKPEGEKIVNTEEAAKEQKVENVPPIKFL